MRRMRAPLRGLAVAGLVLAAQPTASQARDKPGPAARKPSVVDLLIGAAPGAAPLLESTPFGSTKDDVEKKLPHFDPVVGLSTLTDASLIPQYRDGKLEQLWVNGLEKQATARAVQRLTDSWGQPERLVNPIGPVLIWLDRRARVRAELQIVLAERQHPHHGNLFLQPYTPLAEMVGAVPGVRAVLQTQPLLGATVAQLQRTYGASFDEKNRKLILGATEWQTALTIELTLDRGRVLGYKLWFFDGGNPGARTAGRLLLRGILASDRIPEAAGRTRLSLPSGALAELWQDRDAWRVTVTAATAPASGP